MKRTERHHLKENELAHSLASAADFIESNRQTLLTVGAVVVVIALVGGGIYAYRSRTDSRGQDLLADAMTTLNAGVVPATSTAAAPGELPAAATMGAVGTYATLEDKLNAALPKLKAASDAYPDSPAGITARYHYAGTLAALGKYQEAIQAFDDVSARAGDSIYGRMATLGKADTQAQAGQIDQAIATWKSLVDRKDASIPEDALLMHLARAYQTKGDVEEARKTLNQIVEQHPTSPYAAEARVELETLKS